MLESGKTSLTSGSMTTMFVPSRKRAATAPRTGFEKSYSGRIVSRSGSRRGLPLALDFFILAGLAARGESGADETGSWRTLSESYNNQAIPVGPPESQISLLLGRMGRVRE